MTDLRAQIEALPGPLLVVKAGKFVEPQLVYRNEVLRLIPPGAVLVTEETLAAALIPAMTEMGLRFYGPVPPEHLRDVDVLAAAILAALRVKALEEPTPQLLRDGPYDDWNKP